MKKGTLISYCLILASFLSIRAQEDIKLFNYWTYYSDIENVLYKHFCDEAFAQLESRRTEIGRIHSKEEWLERQSAVRNRLLEIIGPFPEKTPLNVQVAGIIQRDGYRIEKIIYESMPGYYVSGALYIPGGIIGKAPAIFYACGHSVDGFKSSTYQHIIINLVKKGFIVLTIDPMGQGERYEYWEEEKGRLRFSVPDHEHSYAGAQCILNGYSLARYFIWDVIRGIDYMLTRTEVDPNRLGMTGRSGGGNITAYLGALDTRILAAAPECYITDYEHILKSIGPQCAEQNLFQMIARGLDHADLIELRAPKPTLIISTTRDFFSIQGARNSYSEAMGIYNVLGAEKMLTMVEDDAVHESTRKNRETMYAFFQEHLSNPGSSDDINVDVPTPEELQVSLTGLITTSFNGNSVYTLNNAIAKQTIEAREYSGFILEDYLDRIPMAAASNSGFVYPDQFGMPVFSGRILKQGFAIEKYLLPGSGNYVLPALMLRPVPDPGKGAILVLHTEGMDYAYHHENLVQALASQGYTVLLMDLPGIGSMGPGYLQGDSYIDSISYNQWFAAVLTGKSFVGLRAGDIIRGIHFLDENTGGSGNIPAIAFGPLGSDLLHSALFEPAISRVCIFRMFLSFEEIVRTRFYNPEFIPFSVPGAIGESDLPDLIAGLCPRKVLIVDPLSGNGSPVDASETEASMRLPLRVYSEKSVPGRLEWFCHLDETNMLPYLIRWLE
jgi:dienelactone hydrolase